MKFIALFSLPQWLKNLLILVPAVFGHAAWNSELIVNLALAFFGFSLLASAVYLLNDLADRKVDVLHPEKSKRPIAAAAISPNKALALIAVFVLAGSALLALHSWMATLIGLSYLGLNLLYTHLLKHFVLLDALFLVQGYWLRLVLGSLVSGLTLSAWVLGIVGLLALYLIFFKRLGDVEVYVKSGGVVRKTVIAYAALPLKIMLLILAALIALAFLAYIVVVFHLQNPHFEFWVYFSVPLVWWSLYRFHHALLQNPLVDPLQIPFRNPGVFLASALAFLLLCFSLYLA